MGKFHVALIAVFCLIAASDAFRFAGDEFARLSIPAKKDESDSKFPDSLFTASFLPVRREAESKSAVPYTRITIRPISTESEVARAGVALRPVDDQSDPKSANFRPINRRFPQNIRSFPARRDFEVSYGNDMLIASNGNSGDIGKPVVPLSHIRRQGINRYLRHATQDAPTNKMLFIRKYNYDRFLVKKRLETIRKLRNEFMGQKEEKSNGFMRSVRKFFGRYV